MDSSSAQQHGVYDDGSAHSNPPLLLPLPASFSRHSSHSDSDGSDGQHALGRSPIQHLNGAPLHPPHSSPFAPNPAYAIQLSPGAASNGSSRDSRIHTPGEDDPSTSADGEANGDFTQTFYDPFRIKHRRRTSPPQLKILEYHFEHNPKPDVTLRKALSEQLDMTPREVQVWFQNRRAKVKKMREKMEKDLANGGGLDGGLEGPFASGSRLGPPLANGSYLGEQHDGPLPSPPLSIQSGVHSHGAPDYLSLRRGSSPAILSTGMVSPGQEQYYDAPPLPGYPTQYSGPRRTQAPSAQSFYAAHPNLPPTSVQPAYSNIYPSPSHSTPSHSPNEIVPEGDYLQPGLPLRPSDDFNGGRRFSLPAYTSNYSMAQQQPHPTHPHQPRAAAPSQQYLPAQDANLYSTAPPVDVHSILADIDFAQVSQEFGAPREELTEDWSPTSSVDEHGYEQAYAPGSVPPHVSHQVGAPPLQQAFPHQPQQFPLAGYSFGRSNDFSAAPDFSPSRYQQPPHPALSDRRQSLPNLGHLAITPQPMPFDYQSNPGAHPSSSLAAPGFGVPAPQDAAFVPLYGSPSNPALQLANNARRGSTTSLLTINETPYLADDASAPQLSPTNERRGSISARKIRSVSNLRVPPYSSHDRRSPNQVGNPHERRGSAPGLEY